MTGSRSPAPPPDDGLTGSRSPALPPPRRRCPCRPARPRHCTRPARPTPAHRTSPQQTPPQTPPPATPHRPPWLAVATIACVHAAVIACVWRQVAVIARAGPADWAEHLLRSIEVPCDSDGGSDRRDSDSDSERGNWAMTEVTRTAAGTVTWTGPGHWSSDSDGRRVRGASASRRGATRFVEGSNPCHAEGSKPCHVKGSNPCHVEGSNPCHAERSNPCHAERSNPCHAERSNPCHAERSNPCHAERSNPCARHTARMVRLC